MKQIDLLTNYVNALATNDSPSAISEQEVTILNKILDDFYSTRTNVIKQRYDPNKNSVFDIVKGIQSVVNDESMPSENKLVGVQVWLRRYNEKRIKEEFKQDRSIEDKLLQDFIHLAEPDKAGYENAKINLKYLRLILPSLQKKNIPKHYLGFYYSFFLSYAYFFSQDGNKSRSVNRVFRIAKHKMPDAKLPSERNSIRFFDRMLTECNELLKKLDK